MSGNSKIFLVQRAIKFATGDVVTLVVDQFEDAKGAQDYVRDAEQVVQGVIGSDQQAFAICGIVSIGHGVREVEVRAGARILELQ